MQDPDDKIESYAADITYGTNSEFGFDYLRDNMAQSLEEKVQHGGRIGEDGEPPVMHFFAIVDEVDNILIDEARTPLIISGQPEQAADLYSKFARLAPQMKSGKTPEGMDPRSKKDYVADFDYEFDEKNKTVAVTEQGVAKAEKFLGIDHLYRAENGHMVNHLIQALKAESLYKRDVDYAVVENEVMIIDEFTGRILEGRRWSEGLHQAVEAKEGVRVQEESQTLATITLQNFFRLYGKLAGMTGTALTEATEFKKIYELGVVQVPTNQPMVRADKNDQVYKTRDGKWHAVVSEIAERHAKGQPVLVGTISVEVSELLGQQLAKRGIPHTVLNAKPEYAEREGEIIAEAGAPGAVTIATNMAGRGVDIKLGGSPEHLTQPRVRQARPEAAATPTTGADLRADPAEDGGAVAGDRDVVMEAGGLFIVGTERHESRRIDNQLRGRAGRQGDPGESRFFLSAEDDLVRLFAGDRIYKILDRLGAVDADGQRGADRGGDADQADREGAEEGRGAELPHPQARPRIRRRDERAAPRRLRLPRRRARGQGPRRAGARGDPRRHPAARRRVHPRRLRRGMEPRRPLRRAQRHLRRHAPRQLRRARGRRRELRPRSARRGAHRATRDVYDQREQEFGDELMRALERYLLLQIIDNRWREHLYDMDYLREGIHLRGFAQIEPIVAYKNEAFDLFTDLMNSIWSDFARMVYHVEVEIEVDDPAGADRVRRAGRVADADRVRHLLRRQRSAAGRRCHRRGRGRRRLGVRTSTETAKRRSSPRPSSSSASSLRMSRWVAMTRAGVGREEVQEVPRRLTGV